MKGLWRIKPLVIPSSTDFISPSQKTELIWFRVGICYSEIIMPLLEPTPYSLGGANVPVNASFTPLTGHAPAPVGHIQAVVHNFTCSPF